MTIIIIKVYEYIRRLPIINKVNLQLFCQKQMRLKNNAFDTSLRSGNFHEIKFLIPER